MYGRSLCVLEYGVSKLSRLPRIMDDLLIIEKKDKDRFVSLCSSRCRPYIPFSILAKKGTRESRSY